MISYCVVVLCRDVFMRESAFSYALNSHHARDYVTKKHSDGSKEQDRWLAKWMQIMQNGKYLPFKCFTRRKLT